MWWRGGLLASLLVCAGLASAIDAQAPDVRGAWRAEQYALKDGPVHEVAGRIFFTSTDWTVLFFVRHDGQLKRASAEGGTYTLSGDQLVFTHLFNYSSGQAVPGLAESPLQMVARDGAGAPTERCRVELAGDRLTIRFPSGNAMMFRRSSTP